MGLRTSGVTTAPANPTSGGGGGTLGGEGGKLLPLNQPVHPPAVRLSANVKLSSGVFQTLNTNLLRKPITRANLGIFFV